MKHLLFVLLPLFLLSCSCRKAKCTRYELNEEEKAFIPYKKGDMDVFRNDVTGQYDTLKVGDISFGPTEEDLGSSTQHCGQVKAKMYVPIGFSQLGSCTISIKHKSTPRIIYSYGIKHEFVLEGLFQTITINNLTYNDVYSIPIDSNAIQSSHISSIPWKIDYSKSEGFLRFHLRNGIVWNKL